MKFDLKDRNRNKLIVILLSISLFLGLALTTTGQAALGDRSLSPGSKGAEVKELQKKLIQVGYQVGKVDGVYGKSTTAAVKRFQKSRGLKADGIAGEKTIAELKKLTGESTTSAGTKVGFKNTDVQLLARCIHAEGRGEPYIGQVAIGACIMNRLKSSEFPNSIAAIIYQPKAFSAVDDGQINMPPDDTAVKAAKEAMSGSDPTGGALFYFNPAKTKNKFIWSRPQIKKIGNHIFTR
ncbi:MAG: spore cortex-lytic enzyme [Peptococcaceae bacterium]|nr:spore cortex-lytic enzyme [Peptococcaceae bacterium]